MNKIKLLLEKYLKRGLKDRDLHLRIVSLVPLIASLFYINYFYGNINPAIPLWYTKNWGPQILAPRVYIYLLPIISIFFTASAFAFSYVGKKFYFTYLSQIILTGATVFNTAILVNVIRISYLAPQKPENLIYVSPQVQSLLFLLLAGFITSSIILPRFIAWAFKNGLYTDPVQHKHPGMILKAPSARGGGFIFSVVFSFLVMLLVEKTPIVMGIVVSTLISGIIGLLDDHQNTHVKSKLKFVENPVVRLLILLPIPVIVMMAFGIISGYINNPFDGNLMLGDFHIRIGGSDIAPLPYLFTFIWTLGIMNLISWSNGVDGQFGGVSTISILMIGILALRLVGTEPSQINTVKIAFLAAGICLGFVPLTWHPSKIMWGFGAVSIGILLSSLSIVSRAKVATSIIVIMIPFLDGIITFFRRLLSGKNPLKGDRGHLHHLLLQRGWSPKKVTVFYWVSSIFFGTVGLLSAEKSSALVTLTLGGLMAGIIIALNFKSYSRKEKANAQASEETSVKELVEDTTPLQQIA